MYTLREVEQLCPVCQLFGATGWKSTINISDFSCDSHNGDRKQVFVAIDRFHGGSKDGALYNIRHFERPILNGNIELTQRTPVWGKGLLALLIRDLEEGDISFGFGRNKGYGSIDRAVVTPANNLSNDDIRAFRERVLEQACAYEFEEPLTPSVNTENHVTQSPQTHTTGDFLNPYQFIPIKASSTSTSHWLDLGEQGDKIYQQLSHHSHAFYRSRPGGEAIYNGRITCSLKTKTPFFIGAGADPIHPDSNDNSTSTPLLHYQLNGQHAIPATSLRGMISALAEAASNSSLRELDDGLLSYRKKASAEESLSSIGLVVSSDDYCSLIPLCDQTNRIYLSNAAKEASFNSMLTWTPEKNVVYYLPAGSLENKVKRTKTREIVLGKKAAYEGTR